MSDTDVATLAAEFRAGSLSRGDLIDDLGSRDYKRPSRADLKPSGIGDTWYNESAKWDEPGTWDEVDTLYNRGLLPWDVYIDIVTRHNELHPTPSMLKAAERREFYNKAHEPASSPEGGEFASGGGDGGAASG